MRNFQTGGQLVSNGLRLIGEVSRARNLNLQTAVFLHANDTFGTAQRNAMDALFPRANLPIRLLESIAYDPRANDLAVEVTRMRALNPDLVMVVTRAGDAIKLVRDMCVSASSRARSSRPARPASTTRSSTTRSGRCRTS